MLTKLLVNRQLGTLELKTQVSSQWPRNGDDYVANNHTVWEGGTMSGRTFADRPVGKCFPEAAIYVFGEPRISRIRSLPHTHLASEPLLSVTSTRAGARVSGEGWPSGIGWNKNQSDLFVVLLPDPLLAQNPILSSFSSLNSTPAVTLYYTEMSISG